MAQTQALIEHYGARAVFAARFVPGLRTVAGPLAGAGGLRPLRFFAANLLDAICYVPWPVLGGYGVGYGLGDRVERLRRATGFLKDDTALFVAILALAALGFIAMTWARHHPMCDARGIDRDGITATPAPGTSSPTPVRRGRRAPLAAAGGRRSH